MEEEEEEGGGLLTGCYRGAVANEKHSGRFI